MAHTASVARSRPSVLHAALGHLPYARAPPWSHGEGSRRGGGYEWSAPGRHPMRRGHTSVELDRRQISRLTAV